MLECCRKKFKPYETWYLYDNECFYDRSLTIGRCPICKKPIALLKETRKADDRIFYNQATGKHKTDRLLDLNKNNVSYSTQDFKKHKMTRPKYLRYGENKIVKKGKKIYQRMNAVSRFGIRECIKDICL